MRILGRPSIELKRSWETSVIFESPSGLSYVVVANSVNINEETPMLELLIVNLVNKPPVVIPGDTGPGPTTLIAGDATEGYFGIVPSTDLIAGNTLAAAIGLTAGSAVNNTVDWQKFIWQGKVLFSPLRGFRTNLNWTNVYQAGAIYGSDTNGFYPSGTPKLQDAKVVIAGRTYRVRVFKTLKDGINTTPAEVGTGSGSSGRCDGILAFNGSEWNRLMYRSATNGGTGQNWASLPDADITAGWTVVQESPSPNTAGCFLRSYPGFGLPSALAVSKGLTVASVAWKPVLELVSP